MPTARPPLPAPAKLSLRSRNEQVFLLHKSLILCSTQTLLPKSSRQENNNSEPCPLASHATLGVQVLCGPEAVTSPSDTSVLLVCQQLPLPHIVSEAGQAGGVAGQGHPVKQAVLEVAAGELGLVVEAVQGEGAAQDGRVAHILLLGRA